VLISARMLETGSLT